MADTTEARRLADELAADVAVLLREGLPQEAMRADKAQAAMRALADERDSLRAQVESLRADAESRLALIDAARRCLHFYGTLYGVGKREVAVLNALDKHIDAARSQEVAG